MNKWIKEKWKHYNTAKNKIETLKQNGISGQNGKAALGGGGINGLYPELDVDLWEIKMSSGWAFQGLQSRCVKFSMFLLFKVFCVLIFFGLK